VNGWVIEGGPPIEDATNMKERKETAQECCSLVKFEFPTIIDTMDDATAITYAAWPERLYVVDKDGKVTYAGGQGPFGFIPTEASRWHKEDKGPFGPLGNSLEDGLKEFFS